MFIVFINFIPVNKIKIKVEMNSSYLSMRAIIYAECSDCIVPVLYGCPETVGYQPGTCPAIFFHSVTQI